MQEKLFEPDEAKAKSYLSQYEALLKIANDRLQAKLNLLRNVAGMSGSFLGAGAFGIGGKPDPWNFPNTIPPLTAREAVIADEEMRREAAREAAIAAELNKMKIEDSMRIGYREMDRLRQAQMDLISNGMFSAASARSLLGIPSPSIESVEQDKPKSKLNQPKERQFDFD